jgi:hypothetical protein
MDASAVLGVSQCLGQLIVIPTRYKLLVFLGRLDHEQNLLCLLSLQLVVLGPSLL